MQRSPSNLRSSSQSSPNSRRSVSVASIRAIGIPASSHGDADSGSYVASGPSCKYPPGAGVRTTARAGDELGLAYRHRDGALGDESGYKGPAIALASRERWWLV